MWVGGCLEKEGDGESSIRNLGGRGEERQPKFCILSLNYL